MESLSLNGYDIMQSYIWLDSSLCDTNICVFLLHSLSVFRWMWNCCPDISAVGWQRHLCLLHKHLQLRPCFGESFRSPVRPPPSLSSWHNDTYSDLQLLYGLAVVSESGRCRQIKCRNMFGLPALLICVLITTIARGMRFLLQITADTRLRKRWNVLLKCLLLPVMVSSLFLALLFFYLDRVAVEIGGVLNSF